MRTLFIIISISILFVSCGKKERPEYKSQTQNNISIYKV
jgi:hypothetical protein